MHSFSLLAKDPSVLVASCEENCSEEGSFSFLQKEELQSIHTAIQFSLAIRDQIPSLSTYLDKKRDLILQAFKGLRFSKTCQPSQLLKICNPEREGRVFSKELGIYKKNRDVSKEALVWELSVLLECDRFIVPSLSFFVHGSEATFQPYLPVASTKRFIREGQKLPVKISLSEYWILSLFAFLVGHSDLNGENLHFRNGNFLLLDNDCSFPSCNEPVAREGALFVPLQNVLLDFDLSQTPLTRSAYKKVTDVLSCWKEKESIIKTYLSLSSLGQSVDFETQKEAFWERWQKILSTPLLPKITLRMFIREIFPEHFHGIEAAQKLASRIAGYSVGPMSALHLLGNYFKYCLVDETTKNEVVEWMELNHY